MNSTKAIEIQDYAASDKEFYPTPPELAEKLLAGIDWLRINTVLEPSAGKGDLIDKAAELCRVATDRRRDGEPLDVDCIEIDPHLRAILKYQWQGQREDDICSRLWELDNKKTYDSTLHKYIELSPEDAEEERRLTYQRRYLEAAEVHIVHDDFLTFQSRKNYDLIIMNPPFSEGDRHLLKALKIAQQSGGEVRCILNAETLRNPYTNTRKALAAKLAELDADISYLSGAFTGAERGTDVEIALIRAKLPAKEQNSKIYERLKAASGYDENMGEVTDIAVTDFLENIIARFNLEVDTGLELIDEYNALRPYLLNSFDENDRYRFPTLTLSVGESSRSYGSDTPSKNRFLQLTRRKYWKALLSNDDFMSRMTSNIREKYVNMVDEMQNYDFSMYNIQQIIVEMNTELSQGVQDTIVSLFDKMTEEHAWYPEMEKNIHYFNGWATNKAHKVNSKVILPANGMFSSYSWVHDTFDVYNAEKTISDIEKVFCYLDGDMTAPVNLHGVLANANATGQTRNIPCRYFSVTLYKKGTMHIKFNDQALVDRFNIYCCQKKNWLPPFYGKKKYDDMDSESQQVIDSFQGREQYEKVMARADYYLAPVTSSSPLPALEAMTA